MLSLRPVKRQDHSTRAHVNMSKVIWQALPMSLRGIVAPSLWALLLLLSACSTVPKLAPPEDASFQVIHQAYAQAVDQALNDPDVHWRAGWLGNIRVNALGDDERGLCWHWQRLVFDAVKQPTSRVGWVALGIGINIGFPGEHHAVLVYDPKAISADDVLKARPTQAAYILDPWRRGKADVWSVAEWLAIPAAVEQGPELDPTP